MFPINITLTLRNAEDLAAIDRVLKALASPVLTEADAAADLAGTPRPAAAPAKAETKPAKTDPKKEQPASPPAQPPAASPAPAPAAAPSAPAAAAASTASSPAPASPGIDYKEVQTAAFKLAGLNRDAAIALAKSMGVSTFKELPAERWAEARDAILAKIAELEVA